MCKRMLHLGDCCALVLLILICARLSAEATGPADEWVDEATGHRVIRLSRRDGSNWTFYFHQNPFTAEGDKMVFVGSTERGRGAFTVDLRTLEVRTLVTDRNIGFEVVAPKRRELFYLSGDTVCATHIDTGRTREICKVPEAYLSGRGFSVNADETLLLGCYAQGEAAFYTLPREEWIVNIFEAKLPNALYTIDIESGAIQEFYHGNAWLGHAQFSPTDPAQVEFCHEGPERRLHRMWLIRTDGSDLRKLYPSSMPNTFVTHEFWDPDGTRVWFDLQIPRFFPKWRFLTDVVPPAIYLACVDTTTGETARYALRGSQYSWHYNISPDGELLCGDGRGFRLTRSARWINLYRPEGGKLKVERLCGMKNHSHDIAPNTHFTPDGKWVVFHSDIHGTPQVYAVQVTLSF